MAAGNQWIDFSRFHSRLRVTGRLRTETALRIGSGGSDSPTEHDLPVVKDLRGRPYIPGSSVKGVLRAHLERLLRGLDERLACLSTSRPAKAGVLTGCLTQGDVDALKAAHQNDPDELARQILKRSCWTCSLFGAPWLASKVMIRDLPVIEETWFERYLIRDGVAIDRDTETAGNQLKYDFEAVPAGTEFTFEMVVENPSEAELGLALLGLREFEQGHIALGGASSRGLGQVRLELDWDRSEWLTAGQLKAYFAGQPPQALADESVRTGYWKAFLAALENGKETAEHA